MKGELARRDLEIKRLTYQLEMGAKDLAKVREQHAEIECLKGALQIAANRLEGVAIAVRIHGTNINPEFFISEYEKYAKEARSIVGE